MEYFSKQVAASSPVNNNKVSITNSFGFVKEDLDFEQSHLEAALG